MKTYTGEHIRNIALGGHSGSGKTSLIESLLFTMGEISRLGKVDQGNTVSDYTEYEIERQVSISASLTHGEWNGAKINMIDTPGFSDFYGDVVSGMRAADTMMIVVSAAAGVEVGTERVRQLADKYNMPRFYVVNLLDRENVSFENIYNELRERFGKKLIVAQIPLQSGPGFKSVVDILQKKMYTYAQDGSGKVTEEDIPGEAVAKVDELRNNLMEAVAESDDDLLEKFFDAGELSEEEILSGFKKAIREQTIVPICCAAATSNIGARSIADFIVDYLPAPSEMPAITNEAGEERKPSDSDNLAALVFKTVSEAHVGEMSYVRVFSGKLSGGAEAINVTQGKSERIGQMYALNGKERKSVDALHAGDIGALVKLKSTHTGDTLTTKGNEFKCDPIDFPLPLINLAVEPKTKGDEDKLGAGMNTLHEEDPTFVVRFDGELKQTIASGQGELHLDIIFKQLKERFGVEVEVGEPRIPYRETIRKKAEAQGKYKKQTGGRGQYGDAHLRIEPLPRGEGIEFVDAITGGVIPGKFIPAVEKGAREACDQGFLANCQVVDIRITVFYGSYHNVDSSENSFKMAAKMGLKKAFLEASPVLLEPIYQIQVKVPEDYMGDVMGDISSRRGKIAGMDSDGRFQVINAKVPLAELHKYTTSLRSMTQGQGLFTLEFSHYEEMPSDAAQKVIDATEHAEEE